MHAKAIHEGLGAQGVKAQEMGSLANVKTAAKDSARGFGETLRAAMGEVKAATGDGRASAPAAVKGGAGSTQGRSTTQVGEAQITAAEVETRRDGGARETEGQRVATAEAPAAEQAAVQTATAPKEAMTGAAVTQDDAPVREVAATMQEEPKAVSIGVRATGARATATARTPDAKAARDGKGVTKTPDGAEMKLAGAQESTAVEAAAAGPAAVGISVTVPEEWKQEVTSEAESTGLRVGAAQRKQAASKTEKAVPVKDQAAAERPVAVSAGGAGRHAAGEVVVVKETAAGELSGKGVAVTETGASVAGSVGGVHGAQGVAAVHAGRAVASAAVATPRMTGGADEVKMLAATPNVLEVGLSDGTHGWLKVRAQVGEGGEVSASLVTATTGQAEVLRRELPALSTYLAGESVEVSTVVVHAAGQAAGLEAGTQDGAGASGMQQGGQAGGSGAEASGDERGGRSRGAGAEEPGRDDLAGAMWLSEVAPAAVLGFGSGSGRWLNVVA